MSNDLIVQWDLPTEEVTDSNGNTFTITTRSVAEYTLEHDVYRYGTNSTETITGVENTEYKFLNVSPGTYTFKLRSFGFGLP